MHKNNNSNALYYKHVNILIAWFQWCSLITLNHQCEMSIAMDNFGIDQNGDLVACRDTLIF
jgi:hypothetical protein